MKKLLLFFLFFGFIAPTFAQDKLEVKEENYFNYLSITEEFDLLVDVSIVNSECATKKIHYYSLVVGTTVIDKTLERVSVLVPCLSNQYVQGDLITIQPIKTPKKDIVFLSQVQEEAGQSMQVIYGAEYRAVWGNVVKML